MASGQDPINPAKHLKNGPAIVSSVNKDRIPSRLDKVRGGGDHHGYLYGDNAEANYRQRDQ